MISFFWCSIINFSTEYISINSSLENLPKIFGFTTIYHSGQPFLCIDGIHAGFISRCVGRGVESSGGILYYGPFRIDKATGALVDVALPGGHLCLICQNIDIPERDHRRIGDIRSFFAVKDYAFFQGDIMNHCKKAVRGNTNSGIPAGDPGDMDV